jgi:short-subunit dehydrogenase
MKLKPIRNQVIVITGASSGIGLSTAQMAARRGACVVLAARSEEKLRAVVDELRAEGRRARYVVTDVSRPEDVERVAEIASREFGGIDTWINDAGVSYYGPALEVPIEDVHRLFDIDYLGTVSGCRAAVPKLCARGGGVIVNVSSVAADQPMPFLAHYSAVKRAIEGFTDALRLELRDAHMPVAVSLIKPGSINTPFTRHAGSLLGVEPRLPGPVYEPEAVAEAILACAEHPRREVVIGAGPRLLSSIAAGSPRLGDQVARRLMHKQLTDLPRSEPGGALWAPSQQEPPSRYGNHSGHVARSSAYTRLALHPFSSALATATLGAVVLWAYRSLGR